MKSFIKWKILIITCLLCLSPIILGVAVWDKLPDTMAIHFDINNNPDNFASKGVAVFGLPFIMVVFQIISCVIFDINAKKYGERNKFERVVKWIIPVMSILIHGVTIIYALNVPVDIRKFVMVIVAGVFIVLGNYMPKFDRIKNKDADTETARKINRVIGIVMVIMGIAALISIFLPPIASVIWLLLLIPYAIGISIYTAIRIKKAAVK